MIAARASWLGPALAAVLAAGCATPPAQSTVPVFAAAPDSTGGVALPALDRGPYLVAVQVAVDAGAVDVVVSAGQAEFARRRMARVGRNLALLPVAGAPGGTAAVHLEAPSSGPSASARLVDVRLFETSTRDAAALATAVARDFERETGRMANPAVENLVANPDFAADDEVRGTPADWYAYVPTAFDAASHELRVEGPPPVARPFLATAPIRVREGARYRAVCRLSVESGEVAMRAVDYDELLEVGSAPAVGAPGAAEQSVFFVVPPGCRAVRLRFEPVDPGAAAAFRVAIVQMEELPAEREGL